MQRLPQTTEGAERRTLPVEDIRIETRDDGTNVLVGLAAPYGKRSEDLGYFIEVIEPGAFRSVLGDDVAALFNHNPDNVLGRTRGMNPTLRLDEDEDGLRYEVDLPDTQVARDLVTNIKRGNIRGNSFSFEVEDDRFEQMDDGRWLRTVKEFRRLYDVGPVTFPAYRDTTVSVRAADMVRQEPRPDVPTVLAEARVRVLQHEVG